MAKFTVFFKDAPIQSELFDSGIVTIGRDISNNIIIDSLAVAPEHAAATILGDETVIRQTNENYPLIVNGQKTQECALFNNDKITIGKHVIVFNTSESNFMETASNAQDSAAASAAQPQPAVKPRVPEGPKANLQIIGGQHIGRLIPLKKSMTRLGVGGNGIVIISKRKDGYFISALETHPSIKVNNQPLGDSSIKLNNNDRILLDNTPMQFFDG